MEADFNYNGMSIYNVNLSDFCTISNTFYGGKNIFTKNLDNQVVGELIRKSDGHNLNFGVCFEGIILDLNNLRNQQRNS